MMLGVLVVAVGFTKTITVDNANMLGVFQPSSSLCKLKNVMFWGEFDTHYKKFSNQRLCL